MVQWVRDRARVSGTFVWKRVVEKRKVLWSEAETAVLDSPGVLFCRLTCGRCSILVARCSNSPRK